VLVGRNALLVLNLGLRMSIVLEDLTSRVIILPMRVSTKICIPPWRRMTRWRVDSFWILESRRVLLKLLAGENQRLLIRGDPFL